MSMKILSNQRGQMAVEYILMAVVLMIVAATVSNYIKSNEVLASFVAKPWSVLAGVIENGVPLPVEKGKAFHPNQLLRHASLRGRRDGQ